VKTTDISKEGSLSGPSFELYASILKEFPEIKVLASGGVRHVDDIRKLDDMGVFAVIFGKAYYEGNITLDDLEEFIVKE
jgi:phosphoribosylformimino-5-aminoimidazole carboxamide ribotide isomerase